MFNVTSQIGHFVTGCMGRKLAQDVEDSERQNNSHIRVHDYAEHIEKHELACNSISQSTTLKDLLIITFAIV